jgi:hypothetical protein
MRWWMALFAAACTGIGGKDDDSGAGDGACELAASSATCPECSEGPTTCAFGGTFVTESSCGGCQARHALLQALCDAGDPTPAAQLDAEIECGPAECRWTYFCSCTPDCSLHLGVSPADTGSSSATDCTPCTPQEPPVGACTWDGQGCSATPTTP